MKNAAFRQLRVFSEVARQLSFGKAAHLCAPDAGDLKDAEDAATRLKHVEAGTLTIGMVSTVKYFPPRLLAQSGASTRAW